MSRDGIGGTDEPAGTLRGRLKRARVEHWRQRKRMEPGKTKPEQGQRVGSGSRGGAEPRAVT